MAYTGSKGPVVVYYNDPSDMSNATKIELPQVDKGKRKETYEDVSERYENINGTFISGPPQWRFKAEYEFTTITGTMVDSLIDVFNRSTSIKLIPHKDFAMINYSCVVDDLQVLPKDGYVMKDVLNIKFTSVNIVTSRPSIDNLIGCMFAYRIGVRTYD